jgi:hypothetical protein
MKRARRSVCCGVVTGSDEALYALAHVATSPGYCRPQVNVATQD